MFSFRRNRTEPTAPLRERLCLLERLDDSGQSRGAVAGIDIGGGVIVSWHVVEPFQITRPDAETMRPTLPPITHGPITISLVPSERPPISTAETAPVPLEGSVRTLAYRSGGLHEIDLTVKFDEGKDGGYRAKTADGDLPGIVAVDARERLVGLCFPLNEDWFQIVPYGAVLRWFSGPLQGFLPTTSTEIILQYAKRLIGAVPPGGEVADAAARLSLVVGEPSLAHEAWEELAKSDEPTARYYLAESLLERNEANRALAIYQELLPTHADDARVLARLAYLYAGRGEPDLAIPLLRKLIEKDPHDSWARSMLVHCTYQDAPEEAFRELKVLYEAGMLPREHLALTCKLLLVDEPENTEMLEVVANRIEQEDADEAELMSLIMVRLQFDDLQAANRAADQAAQLPPKLTFTWNLVGTTYLRCREYAKAVIAFQEALWLEPDSAVRKADLAFAKAKAGENEDVAALAEEAIRADAKLAEAWAARAILRTQASDPDGANEDFQRALELTPELKQYLRLELARVWIERGEKDKALDCYFEEAQGPFKDSGWEAGIYGLLARALVDAGRSDEALAWIEKSRRLTPHEKTVYEIRAMAQAEVGTIHETIETLKILIRLADSEEDRKKYDARLAGFIGIDTPKAEAKYDVVTRARIAILSEAAFTAVDLLEKHLSAAPEDGEAWDALACAYEEASRFEAALQAFTKALELGTEDIGGVTTFAELAAKRKDEALLEKMVDMLPETRKAIPEAFLHFLKDDLKTSRPFFDALVSNPEALINHRIIGSLYQEFYEDDRIAGEQFCLALMRGDDYLAYTGLGRVLVELDRLDEADRAFDAALRMHPDFGHAWYGKGMVAMREGRFEDAGSHFAYAMRFRGTIDIAVFMRVRALLALDREKYRESSAQMLRVLIEERRDPPMDAWPILAELEWERGEAGEALRLLHEVLKEEPDSLLANRTLARILHRRGDFAEAVPHWEKVISINPADAQSRLEYATCLKKIGRLEASQKALEDLCAEYPDEPAALVRLGAVMEELHEPGALALFERAAEVAHYSRETRGPLIGAYQRAGEYSRAAGEAFALAKETWDPKDLEIACVVAIDAKRHPEAAKLVREALERQPGDPQLITLYAKTHRVEEDYEKAAPLLWKAYGLAPQDRSIRETLFDNELILGRLQNALEIALAWLKEEPGDEQAHWYAAVSYGELAMWKEALPHAIAAYNHEPPDLERLRLLARAHREVGDLKEATRLYEDLMVEGSEWTDLVNAGQAYRQLGDSRRAIELLKAGVSMAKDDWRPLIILISTLADNGHIEEARALMPKLDALDRDKAMMLRRDYSSLADA